MKKKDALAEFAHLIDWYRPMLAVDTRAQFRVIWQHDLEPIAECTQWNRRRIVEMRIGKEYGQQSWRDRCQTAIHELLHVAQHGMISAVNEAGTAGLLGDEAQQFRLRFDQQHELFTDDLAEVLVDLLPMPAE